MLLYSVLGLIFFLFFIIVIGIYNEWLENRKSEKRVNGVNLVYAGAVVNSPKSYLNKQAKTAKRHEVLQDIKKQESPSKGESSQSALKALKALTSFCKVRVLRLRNIFLSPEEREEWLGDLKEVQYRMRYIENRSRWVVWAYTIDQHVRFGWSKLVILVSSLISRIIGS